MLTYISFGMLIFVFMVLFYGIIAIHDIPYEISVRRKHPHQDAIHVAGWISLFTLHAIWPFLWIWATLYREDRGWGFEKDQAGSNRSADFEEQLSQLDERIEKLEKVIKAARAKKKLNEETE